MRQFWDRKYHWRETHRSTALLTTIVLRLLLKIYTKCFINSFFIEKLQENHVCTNLSEVDLDGSMILSLDDAVARRAGTEKNKTVISNRERHSFSLFGT